MEYERLEPFGSWRDNWHMAVLATITANAARNPKHQPIRPDVFFYKDPESAADERDQEMLGKLRMLRKHGNG